ncbi:hypothetical protein B0T16DRAFT_299997, partial [Cercophora newfieldiana]
MPADASASGASANGGATHNRQHNQGNQDRKYTVEQKAAVLRIRACKPTAFYEILEIQKSCSDSEVKKAYRKQSLLTHPDKNGHEFADEAFKMVSRAFSILGDKEKREKFDRFGTDPDNRFDSAQAQNPFAGFANRGGAARAGGGGGGMWEEDISPEEMFARFFGGGGFNGPFGGGFDAGPQFVFNFGGGPGIRVHQFGGARPRGRPRNPGQEEEPSILSTIVGLLPIILLFIFPLLSSMFSGAATGPEMTFDRPTSHFSVERTMPNYGYKYYVNKDEVSGKPKHKLATLDSQAELKFANIVNSRCHDEERHRQRLEEAAQGWFGPDPEKMAVARSYNMPNCVLLKSL